MEGYFLHIASRLDALKVGPTPTQLAYLGEVKSVAFWRAVLAEFVGTMLFVFVGCGSILPMTYGTFEAAQVLRVGFTFGLMIMVLIQMFGHVSGGHFNPAVSIAMAIARNITPTRAVLYTVVQCCGGMLGGLILKGVTPDALHKDLGVTAPSALLDGGQAFGCECIYSFLLVFSIFGVTDSNRPLFGNPAVGIGLTVAVLHFGGIPYTGASMNPARSLGAAVVSNSYDKHWVYWVGPIVGGALAALAYKYIFSPYRGAITTEEATNKLLGDADMIVIPKSYFKDAGNLQGPKEKETDTHHM